MSFAWKEALAVLEAVEAGEVSARHGECPQRVISGHIDYVLSNGWNVRVFDDCDSFDYVEAIRPPDGEWAELGYDDGTMMGTREREVFNFHGSWGRWGIGRHGTQLDDDVDGSFRKSMATLWKVMSDPAYPRCTDRADGRDGWCPLCEADA